MPLRKKGRRSSESEEGGRSLHQVAERRQVQLLLLLLLGDRWLLLLLPGSHVARHQPRWCERLERREICTRQLVLCDEGMEGRGSRKTKEGGGLHHLTFCWCININHS